MKSFFHLTAFLLLAWIVFNSAIQLKAQNDGYSGGGGHFYTGTAFFNLSHVNDFLNTKQLPSFGNTCLTLGGGGFGIFNNFMLGGEGGVVSASSVANSIGEASLAAGYGMFNIGYTLPVKSRFLFYPMIGMGWGGSDLNLKFADGTKADYTTSRYFLSTEFNVELYSFGAQDGYSKGGFKAGLCVGYLFNPLTSA